MSINPDDYEVSGAHILRAYLLAKLVAEGLVVLADYPLPPFIPTQESQDFDNAASGKPYIVYNYTTASYQNEWWLCPETMAMRVYSDDEADIRRICNYLLILLRRADWTAADINAWVSASTNDEFKKFEFKTCQVNSLVGPDEYESPDGRQAGIVVIRYEYTRLLEETEGTGLLA